MWKKPPEGNLITQSGSGTDVGDRLPQNLERSTIAGTAHHLIDL